MRYSCCIPVDTELTFKRPVRSSAIGATKVAFILIMNLFIYSDESGVFDKKHNDYFIFGGIICFGTNQKEKIARRYRSIEKLLKVHCKFNENEELKACRVSNKIKYKLYKSLNRTFKFCVLIKQKQIINSVFENPKHKQRYLDYAYKICLKKCLKSLVEHDLINPYLIENIYVSVDEHHTATDGLYELRENLLNEFKYGTFNDEWNVCYEPVFPGMKDMHVQFCDSSKTLLVRAADIVANHFYHLAIRGNGIIPDKEGCFIYELPSKKMITNSADAYRRCEL